MIVVSPIRSVVSPLIRADSLFPEVCVNKDFSYETPENSTTQLIALQDAERAFSLYKTCNYQIPTNFSLGIEKVSSVVGEEVTAWNVKRLRKNLEAQLSGAIPEIDRSALGQLKSKVIGLFL